MLVSKDLLKHNFDVFSKAFQTDPEAEAFHKQSKDELDLDQRQIQVEYGQKLWEQRKEGILAY